jgi:hypothetical protein
MLLYRAEGQSGQTDPPPQGDGSILKAMLHRIDSQTKRFVRLKPDDRQLYLPLVGKPD